MRRALAILLIIQFIGIAPAFAQTGDEPRIQYVEFDPMDLEAQRKDPLMFLNDGSMKPKFKRLLRLKKSLLPKIRETADSPALH